ncbi:trehalose-6-phosphate synthase [Caballeronia sp. S22]|uniref:trehalose-6-phosphate synthase n=1 Tax=Caballeronia sp. S22 TaxID=3137182 RepID=UPI0035312BCF
MRALGCGIRIGFFLYIPMPPPLIMAAIPEHEWLMKSLFAYDLVGLQSESDVTHFCHYVESEARAERLSRERLRVFNRTLRVGAYPIGIDIDEFLRLAEAKGAAPRVFFAHPHEHVAPVCCWASIGSTIRRDCRSESRHSANCSPATLKTEAGRR